jgi:DNA (cytosine-5)-methyltransferase 1
MVDKLTIADFFCGAGGFSEGFRQAGFKIAFALDNWNFARQTHKLNHPESKHPGLDCHFETNGDILNIPVERINEIVDDVNVIVGSPPCVSFSTSNKAGKADKSLGLKLIEKYLQIVAVKKHKKHSKLKYWLMENVPNSRNFIKKEYTFISLGLNNEILESLEINKNENDVALRIDNSIENVYNSVDFGVPQKRARFICGEYPRPQKTVKEKEWITLGSVIKNLNSNESKIIDPNYNLTLPNEDLTDHFYDTKIHPFEWEEAKIKKQQARYYGKMSFPENENKPSRTVMATRSVLSRESMILSSGLRGNYRSPTIREVASLMSFPITYLFQANTEASKYRLVGNAVCPKLSYSFAVNILNKEGINIKKPLIFNPKKEKLTVDLRKINPLKKEPKDKHPLSNFAEIVPDLKYNNFRVELDNGFPRNTKGIIIWSASLHHATGKNDMKVCRNDIDKIEFLLQHSKYSNKINSFNKRIKSEFEGRIINSSLFQQQHCKVEPDSKYLTPRKFLGEIRNILNQEFPEDKFKNTLVENNNILDFGNKQLSHKKIPLKIVLAFYSVKYFTNIIARNIT